MLLFEVSIALFVFLVCLFSLFLVLLRFCSWLLAASNLDAQNSSIVDCLIGASVFVLALRWRFVEFWIFFTGSSVVSSLTTRPLRRGFFRTIFPVNDECGVRIKRH